MKSLEEAEKEKLIIARAEKLDELFRFERFNMIIRAPKDSEEFKKGRPGKWQLCKLVLLQTCGRDHQYFLYPQRRGAG